MHDLHALEPIPHAQDMVFKPAFVQRYQDLLGDRYDEFIRYSLSFMRKGIRVNTLKCSVADLVPRLQDSWRLHPVPWTPHGFWIEHKGVADEKRRDVGNIPEHALGYFYVQDPASMIPPIVLDPQPGECVLDMCASPGSKASQIAMYMENKGVLVANEMTITRLAPLKVNLQRCGVTNALITQSDGRQIKGAYHRILVDAPCSGVGTIRKSLKTVRMWNPKMISRLSRIQLTLLNKAYDLLLPGGVLVYSTCTLEPEENEGVVSAFLRSHPDMTLADIDLPIVRSAPVRSFDGEEYVGDIDKVMRIWPMDNDTEGFFIATMKKSL